MFLYTAATSQAVTSTHRKGYPHRHPIPLLFLSNLAFPYETHFDFYLQSSFRRLHLFHKLNFLYPQLYHFKKLFSALCFLGHNKDKTNISQKQVFCLYFIAKMKKKLISCFLKAFFQEQKTTGATLWSATPEGCYFRSSCCSNTGSLVVMKSTF